MLFYNIEYAQVKIILTIRDSNSYQDVRQTHWNLV